MIIFSDSDRYLYLLFTTTKFLRLFMSKKVVKNQTTLPLETTNAKSEPAKPAFKVETREEILQRKINLLEKRVEGLRAFFVDFSKFWSDFSKPILKTDIDIEKAIADINSKLNLGLVNTEIEVSSAQVKDLGIKPGVDDEDGLEVVGDDEDEDGLEVVGDDEDGLPSID